MKPNNASTITFIERKVRLLIKEKEDLDQMRADAQEMQRFRRLIVHENND